MRNESPTEVYVLSARDAGRIMPMLNSLTAAVDSLLEARQIFFEASDRADDHEQLFDEAQGRLFEDDPQEPDLGKLF